MTPELAKKVFASNALEIAAVSWLTTWSASASVRWLMSHSM